MAAFSTSDFPLGTDLGSYPDEDIDGSDAGATGASNGSYSLSHGALVAIIVVVCVVSILGIGSSVLFYLAKKREWKVRETIRRSAKRVVTALTPRRSEFPRSVKQSGGRFRGHMRMDDVPPTPQLKSEHLDLEKGSGKPGWAPGWSRR